jgi:hypothetical protein
MAPRHREVFLRLSLEKRVVEKFVLAGRQNQRARRPRSPELAITSLCGRLTMLRRGRGFSHAQPRGILAGMALQALAASARRR